MYIGEPLRTVQGSESKDNVIMCMHYILAAWADDKCSSDGRALRFPRRQQAATSPYASSSLNLESS